MASPTAPQVRWPPMTELYCAANYGVSTAATQFTDELLSLNVDADDPIRHDVAEIFSTADIIDHHMLPGRLLRLLIGSITIVVEEIQTEADAKPLSPEYRACVLKNIQELRGMLTRIESDFELSATTPLLSS